MFHVGIEFLNCKLEAEKNYGYFPILVGDDYSLSRNELYECLRNKGIYTRKYFYPLTSEQACFKNKYRDVDLKCAQELSNRILVLPLYEGLKSDIVQEIVGYIKNERKKSYI